MEKIAIVGLGVLFPGAKNVEQFWQNILEKKVSIKPLPESLFESDVYYRPELLNSFNKADKSITKIAGWIEDLSFDTVRKYKIPPSVAEHMDSNQHAALYTTAQALEMNSLQTVARDRVAVILGNGMVGTRYGDAMFRVQFQLMEHSLRQHPVFIKLSSQEQEAIIDYVREQVLKGTIPISEDTAPGVLPNIIAGRIANVYDFHGPSFTVDAACASVLAAVITGIQGLALKDYDAVICGGADMPLKQLGFVLFSALNALSPDGSYPFDERANGFVMGQGAGTVILKRLEDAIRDQDMIFSVITGYGEASDGKGKYIAAPNAQWQAYTIEKACRMAGYPVDTIEMIEAHGTATKVGDVVEVDGLKQAFANLGAKGRNSCGLTSVKSNIGHLKSAAGIAGLIKSALAIHHQILPPTANFAKINPKLELNNSPFYILDTARPWHAHTEYPRRANVSSFGFGGADYHLALEEFRPSDYSRPSFPGHTVTAPRNDLSETNRPVAATATMIQNDLPTAQPAMQIIFFGAPDSDILTEQASQLIETIHQYTELPFDEHCTLHNDNLPAGQNCRLAILASSVNDLQSKIEFFQGYQAQLGEERSETMLHSKGIYYKQGRPVTPGETALLFPGQASQYPNMLRSLFNASASMRAWLRKADAYWFTRYQKTVSALIFSGEISDEEALEQLRQTHNAHPTIFVASYAIHDLLVQMGLTADYMVGHSLGEITALAASGKLSFIQALSLVEQRGFAFLNAGLVDPGQMISLAGSLEEAQRLAAESLTEVSVANINSPKQVVLAGKTKEIQKFKQFLDQKKIQNKLLYVSHAFHSPLMQPVADRFFQGITAGQVISQFSPSPVKVAMNHSGGFYPDDSQAIARDP